MKWLPRVSFVIVIGLSFATGYLTCRVSSRSDMRSLVVANELREVTYTVNSLSNLPDNPEKVAKLQLLALRSSLQHLDEMTLQMERFPIPTKSFQESLKRAIRYGESSNQPDIAAQARAIQARLFGGA